MRVLLSGGRKTQNILDGINKKFNTTGDEFIIVEYLDDIMDIFSKGDYFDKALITEQSITRDGEIIDNLEIRRRVAQFSASISDRASRHNFVFLAADESIAEMIYDEILNIYDDSAIVLQSPPYGVNFFVRLIVTEAKELPSDWVYEPALSVPEQIEVETQEAFTSVEESMDYTQFPELPADDTLYTDTSSDMIDSSNFGNGFGQSDNNGFSDMDSGMSSDFTGSSIFTEENNLQNNSGFDGMYNQSFDTDYSNPANQFTEDSMYEQAPKSKLSLDKEPVESVNTGFIPGFDSDDTYDNTPQNTDMFGQDMYGNAEVQQDMYGNTQNDSMFGQDMYGNTNNGFDSDMYGNSTVEASGFNQDMYGNNEVPVDSAVNDGFGSDMYGAEAMDQPTQDISTGFESGMYGNTDNDYMNNVNNDMYGNMGNAAMAAGAVGAMGAMASEINQMNNAQQTKKKGLGALFGKKKNTQNPYMEMAGQLNTPQPVQSWQQEQPTTIPMPNTNNAGPNINVIKEQLRPFATRGNSIVVTGCGGCGTSVIAYNLANIISQLGYSVLLVDMDVEGRTQNYISKANYESMEPYGANLVSAVNSSGSSNAHESIVKQGFHLLTMGLSSDTAPVSDMLHKEKISRFINSVKSYHNFVIYDIPFQSAVGYLSDITYMADNLVLVTDASNWGITKMMLSVCDIASDDMRDTVFNRAQLVFNRQRNLKKVLGRKVRNGLDIAKVIDMKVKELIGEEPEYYFEEMHIAGIIEDDPAFEDYWFENTQYSDTKKGQAIFLKLLEHIVLKK